jgi:hypothetical protein
VFYRSTITATQAEVYLGMDSGILTQIRTKISALQLNICMDFVDIIFGADKKRF